MSLQKPSEREEEYFARQEFERRKKLAEERARALEAREQARLRQLHRMGCPKCGSELVEVEFRGARIDKCTSCAGLWLDAGELEQVTAKGDFVGGLLRVFGGR
ncbi:MAG: zf-TFIIB domain-containing protein [Candidatus Rokubacteria bacterium]|nr:zf-TFIIB domain-containing protein [Candidatus Rokubacteria bacterium]